VNNSILEISAFRNEINLCKLHNDYSKNVNLPCAFPNCKYGIKENKFAYIYNVNIVNKELKEKKHIYTRKKFKGIKDDIKYIWLRENEIYHPLYNIIFDEVFVINKIDIKKTLFHYTKLENLYSILNSNELWLTQYDCLSDEKEITYGYNLFREYKIFNDIDKRLNSNNLNYFLACFSFESNYEYLFTNYADDSKGVSIEFNFEPNFWFSEPQFLYLMPVIYDITIQKKIIEYCKYLFEDFVMIYNSKEKIEVFKEYYISIVEELVPFFKDVNFKDEKEVRWLYKMDKNFINKYWGEILRIRENKHIKKKYYTSTDIARELSPSEDDIQLNLPIKSITIGSNVENQNDVYNKIKTICNENGFRDIEIKMKEKNKKTGTIF
jgi:hypothetical protein